MTLGSLLLAFLPWFFGAVMFGLFLDFLLNKKKRAAASKALVKPAAPTRPAERRYTADEVRALAEEFHARKMAESKPTVKFGDWYDPETGEVFE